MTTVVKHQSYGSRLAESIKGVLVGALLLLIAFPLLFWNEGRAVKTWKSLKEGSGAVISVPSDKVDAANEGKLVAMTGDAATKDVLSDSKFAISLNAIRLDRDVEMYQWKESKHEETQKNAGGSTDTYVTYDYEKGWVDHVLDSDQYHDAGYDNPKKMEFAPASLQAKDVKVGAYQLPSEMVEKINEAEPLALADADLAKLPVNVRKRAHLTEDGGLFVGYDSSYPEVGDLRIHFKVVKPQTVSLIAQQTGSTFQPYQTVAGGKLSILYAGTKTAAEMFAAEQSANVALTWMLRILGFMMISGGLFLAFKPFAVMSDVIPVVGNLLGAGIGLFSAAIGFGLTTLTVALGWIVYRPLIGIPLFLVAIGAIAGMAILGKRRKESTPAALARAA